MDGILNIFKKRWWIMLMAAVAAAAALWAGDWILAVPEYESTAALYILPQSEQNSDPFSLALKISDDCVYILGSSSVLEEVVRQVQPDMDAAELKEHIYLNNPENTRIIEVTVTTADPQQAKQLADAVCAVGEQTICEVMGFDAVDLYEPGSVSSEPCGRLTPAKYILAGLMAAMVVFGAFGAALLAKQYHPTENQQRAL